MGWSRRHSLARVNVSTAHSNSPWAPWVWPKRWHTSRRYQSPASSSTGRGGLVRVPAARIGGPSGVGRLRLGFTAGVAAGSGTSGGGGAAVSSFGMESSLPIRQIRQDPGAAERDPEQGLDLAAVEAPTRLQQELRAPLQDAAHQGFLGVFGGLAGALVPGAQGQVLGVPIRQAECPAHFLHVESGPVGVLVTRRVGQDLPHPIGVLGFLGGGLLRLDDAGIPVFGPVGAGVLQGRLHSAFISETTCSLAMRLMSWAMLTSMSMLPIPSVANTSRDVLGTPSTRCV